MPTRERTTLGQALVTNAEIQVGVFVPLLQRLTSELLMVDVSFDVSSRISHRFRDYLGVIVLETDRFAAFSDGISLTRPCLSRF